MVQSFKYVPMTSLPRYRPCLSVGHSVVVVVVQMKSFFDTIQDVWLRIRSLPHIIRRPDSLDDLMTPTKPSKLFMSVSSGSTLLTKCHWTVVVSGPTQHLWMSFCPTSIHHRPLLFSNRPTCVRTRKMPRHEQISIQSALSPFADEELSDLTLTESAAIRSTPMGQPSQFQWCHVNLGKMVWH